ncbi:hypothetical protein Y1Q_0019990 [Alligator mississippiensis]|uniref:Uncharacterized protein n=1 Tax=Alligator mississippiensis TaxID=8496 RepID=A0A151PE03_ALLMI|nr:hypothetical protein Y1Q_0019990 [Alligator mississippiensis]
MEAKSQDNPNADGQWPLGCLALESMQLRKVGRLLANLIQSYPVREETQGGRAVGGCQKTCTPVQICWDMSSNQKEGKKIMKWACRTCTNQADARSKASGELGLPRGKRSSGSGPGCAGMGPREQLGLAGVNRADDLG